VTGFGSYDNSTCKRVLDQLEPRRLRFGRVVIKRVAVVELGVNNGSGDGGSCSGIKVWTDTAKLYNGYGNMVSYRRSRRRFIDASRRCKFVKSFSWF